MTIEQKVINWFLNGNTGVSSESLVAIAFDVDKTKRFGLDYPHDNSDFRRCCELLWSIPELKPMIEENIDKHPKIKHIYDRFDEWEPLLIAQLNGCEESGLKLYSLMKEAQDEMYDIDGITRKLKPEFVSK